MRRSGMNDDDGNPPALARAFPLSSYQNMKSRTGPCHRGKGR